MAILNLTQHNSTADQINAGIIDLPVDFKTALVAAITFPAIYNKTDLESAAGKVYELVRDYIPYLLDGFEGVMIGGMPSFMPVLENLLISKGIRVGYACTERKSVDKTLPDGSVQKTAVFVHAGMYWAN